MHLRLHAFQVTKMRFHSYRVEVMVLQMVPLAVRLCPPNLIATLSISNLVYSNDKTQFLIETVVAHFFTYILTLWIATTKQILGIRAPTKISAKKWFQHYFG